jgi:hypothetical protein
MITGRRGVQILLTPRGRRGLAAEVSREAAAVIRLLNGLDTREMRRVANVLRVIRRRLQCDEHERRSALEGGRQTPRGS